MQIIAITSAIGAVQGIFLLLSILFRFRHRKSLPLALLIIVFSLRLATIPAWREDILFAYPWIYPLTSPLPFLFGPLLWRYIRESAGKAFNRPRLIYIHFLPYFFEVTALVYTVLTSINKEEYAVFLDNVFSGNPPLWFLLRNSLKVILNICYMIFAAKIAFGNKSINLSPAKRLWIKSLVVVPSVVLACYAYVAVNPAVTANIPAGNVTPFLILSVTMLSFIYVISFFFMISPDFPLLKNIQAKETQEQLCSDIECRILVDRVEKVFDDGAFKNPDLTLSDLASELDVHPNRLSYAVNNCSRVSFRSYLNNRRLDYYCSKIEKGAHNNKSILDLAFEAGFPSKSTFNRVFREKTGMSPSEYVKKSE